MVFCHGTRASGDAGIYERINHPKRGKNTQQESIPAISGPRSCTPQVRRTRIDLLRKPLPLFAHNSSIDGGVTGDLSFNLRPLTFERFLVKTSLTTYSGRLNRGG